jgi:hypothetical protein
MAVQIKGQKTVRKFNGDEIIEVDGVGVPTQTRINYTNPLLFEGDIRWYQSCLIPETGEIVKAKKESFSNSIADIDKSIVLPIAAQTENAFTDITIGHFLEAMKAYYILSAGENEALTNEIILPAEGD